MASISIALCAIGTDYERRYLNVCDRFEFHGIRKGFTTSKRKPPSGQRLGYSVQQGLPAAR
jgi:hypothetical protein